MRIAGYFHEIDDWCPVEVYPLHVQRIDAVEAHDLLREGFMCSPSFEARAVIMGFTPGHVTSPRAIENGDALVLMRDWGGTKARTERYWWLVTRCP